MGSRGTGPMGSRGTGGHAAPCAGRAARDVSGAALRRGQLHRPGGRCAARMAAHRRNATAARRGQLAHCVRSSC
eukprot:2779255-Prymnesium_polylepis.1